MVHPQLVSSAAQMYILAAQADDACTQRIEDELSVAGHDVVRVVQAPPGLPEFSWSLSNAGSASSFCIDGHVIRDDELDGVFVRPPLGTLAGDWVDGDRPYAASELGAATVAWLAGLDCRVINRHTASTWFSPRPSGLRWRRHLTACGLAYPPTILTNNPRVARSFATQHGVWEAVVASLAAGRGGVIVQHREEWTRLNEFLAQLPAMLSPPHGVVSLACVVGERVIVDGDVSLTSGEAASLSRLATRLGLEFMDVALVMHHTQVAVLDVAPVARFDLYSPAMQEQVVSALATRLTRMGVVT